MRHSRSRHRVGSLRGRSSERERPGRSRLVAGLGRRARGLRRRDADRVVHYFGAIKPGEPPARIRTVEPEQTGERRLAIRKEGTTAYLKVGYHAPSATDPRFAPLLILDAVLTGAKGVNLWSSFRVPPPQRSARLYRALVETGLASCVSGSLMPTAEPFLYTLSATATDGTTLDAVGTALLDAIGRLRNDGITEAELAKAKAQLRARLVFDNDSVTNIAHQLGYFETIATVDLFTTAPAAIAGVTLDAVAAAARATFSPSNRTIGWFEPLRSSKSEVRSLKSEVWSTSDF